MVPHHPDRLLDLDVVRQVGGARLGDQELAELLLPPLHPVGDRVQHARPVLARRLRPGTAVEGAPGGGDGAPHVVDGRVGRGADRLLGGGVGDRVGRARHEATGEWPQPSLSAMLAELVRRTPERIYLIEGRRKGGRSYTFADLAARAERMAGALLALEVRPGEVVSWQLPNWFEGAAL